MPRFPIGRALGAFAAALQLGGSAMAAVPPAAARASAAVALVDVNSASRAQLEKLPGIGKAESEKIVAGRPYHTKADLATGKVLPTGVYLMIKNRIIAKPPARPASAAGKASKQRDQG